MDIKEKFSSVLGSFDIRGGVVVALSGGADSVCLLDLFMTAKKEGRFPYTVVAAHLDHMLRGKESDRDVRFCEDLCKKYGIYLFVCHSDINARAKETGMSIEQAAREARYSFLEGILEANENLSHIATAHNKGDMCETMILNLARGSSIDGLCSIPSRRGNIIRPLLFASRSDILAYNNDKGLSFVTDSTNLDTKYSRNRVRLNILPEFKKIYSGYEDNLERTARLLKRDADYLSAEADRLYTVAVHDGILHTKKAQNFHISLLSRIIKKLYNYHGFKDISELYIDSLCQKIHCGSENFTLSLHGCTAICERGMLTFKEELPHFKEFCFDIALGESVTLPTGLLVSLSKEGDEGSYPLKTSATSGRLTVRSRRDGDTVTFFGKTHKVKRIISDKKLSTEEKSKLFFLCSDEEIIYSNIPTTADKAFVRKGESDCIFITVKDTGK
ncbi:MAG: tRNA lysidine(34) synthetase TilS [Clostridia bacterium]|nr:tRNA lysidine(34) synthetase TilS [Clostridia bacterium]